MLFTIFEMKISASGKETTLEEQLFKNILYLGIAAVVLLIIYDSLFTRYYHSVVIEVFAGIMFVSYFFILKHNQLTKNHKYVFSLLLFVIINLGWITGSGVSLMNAAIYFLIVAIALILNDSKIYLFIFVLVLIDLVFLFSMQYFTDLWFNEKYITEKQNLLNAYVITAVFIIAGSYLIIFLKLNYNREHEKLLKSNSLLQEKSAEISYQNEELKMSKEALDQLVNQLEKQTNELMAIKGSLEENVNERTEDLMKLNERLIAQNQQLEQYAYITSHNLRAPVTQIKGLISVLPDKAQLDPLTNETLQRIIESARNLEKVFEDLSEIIKVEKGMQHPWQDVDLNEEIDMVLESLKSSLEQKKIKVIKALQPHVAIKALKPYVYSIFHNIIENAVKYSDQNKPESYIKFEVGESSKYYHLAVTDNGIGIDMEMASGKIFQMYQRFNNTHPGQGFGLFLVKSQMEAMEGKVELESILGQGTTFNLYFLKR